MSDSSGEPRIDRFQARAFSRVTEISERVQKALLNLYPENVHKHVVIRENVTEGHYGTPIRILTAVATKEYAEQSVRFLFSSLSEKDAKLLLRTFDRRIDEDCTFFLRIDKQAAYLGHISLARVPDVISCEISIRKIPRCLPEDARSLIATYVSLAGDRSE